MEEHIDVDEFMAYVRSQGFEIQDNLFTHGIRRFVISKNGHSLCFDIDRAIWNKMDLDGLIRDVDRAIRHEVSMGVEPVRCKEQE